MPHIAFCCVDGCDQRIGLVTYPPLCDDCRDRLAAKRAATERKREARRQADADRGHPGDLTFTPNTNHERREHKRALKDKNYGNARY